MSADAAIERYGRSYQARQGRALFFQGDKAEAAYLLRSGRVGPVKYRADGRPLELPPLGPGAWLGLAELKLGLAYLCDAVALEACEALAFSRRSFALAAADAEFSGLVAEALAREVLALHFYIEDESPEEKLLSFLLARRGRLAGMEKARIEVTQERIARSIGVTRETVNKRLAGLEARGLLKTLRGEIEVLDWDGLAALREPD
jgi:CRP-like cAMP-binding protein